MKIAVLALLAIAIVTAAVLHFHASPTPVRQPLTQDAYIWQRSWTPAVCEAIRKQSPQFNRLVILAAEMSPREDDHVAQVHADYASIRGTIHTIGVAIRVGPLPASHQSAFDSDSTETASLCGTARQAVAAACTAGLGVSELQVDFDCAESKLAGYAKWVRAVRSVVSPVPLVITALPSWLKHPEFSTLAQSADGFVIQVHSLHQPASPESNLNLCDPIEARRAVALASTLGLPFRVALPTYSYLAGFSPAGELLGLSAEGPAPAWPADVVIKRMDSDPVQLARLVREWTAAPPANMTGIIWYRLPVEGDRLNWPAVTLGAVMHGIAPHAQLVAVAEHSEHALFDLYLKNIGNAAADDRIDLIVTWTGANVVASEPLEGFDCLEQQPGKVIFRQSATDLRRITPAERIHVGWLRLSTDTEVRTYADTAPRN